MSSRDRKLERVVYEEKPHCGRCGAGIVGVIPKRHNGKPLCRECAFELEQMALKSTGRVASVEEDKPPLTREERIRRNFLIGVFTVACLFLLFRVHSIAPLLQAPKPLRQGVTATDALTDKCIGNLWRLSKLLQENKLPAILPVVCPKTSRQYVVTQLENDTIISCPNPEEHGLAKLSVSLKEPIPHAVAMEGQ